MQMTTDLSELDKVPYFLWNEETTVRELRLILSNPDDVLRPLYAARVMREGRVRDVWAFLTLQDVVKMWPQLERHLGRRRRFWQFLMDAWKQLAVI